MLGKVRRIEPTANRQNATVEVKIAIADPHERMVPEMGGVAVFLKAGGEDTARAAERIVVPAAAIVTRDGRTGVFRVESGVVQFGPVTTGATEGAGLLVLKGLSGGERVVLDPPDDLADGQRVEVQP